MANAPHDSKRPPSKAVQRALEANDMDALKAALSFRQRRFCEEYACDFQGNAAAIRAGYSIPTATEQSYQLLRNPGVVRYIDHLTQSTQAKALAADPDYVIQQVLAITGKDSTKDGDRLRGLELLARILGMLVNKTEISGKDGEAIKYEKVREDADAFTRAIAGLQKRGGDSVIPFPAVGGSKG